LLIEKKLFVLCRIWFFGHVFVFIQYQLIWFIMIFGTDGTQPFFFAIDILVFMN